VGNVVYKRERVTTPDNDFLDLDWSFNNSQNLVIISHGLEGDSQRPYVKGMVRALNLAGFDVLAWNYRGCSGEMNNLCRFYHSGETQDLHFVYNYVLSKSSYQNIILLGFSIGGNITLKYVGEQGKNLDSKIKAVVTFSVPCHLESGARHLAKFKNRIYMMRFIKSLRTKIKAKSLVMPDSISYKEIEKLTTFLEFDEVYTAPTNGFKNAKEYWTQSSSLYYLPTINVPTLLVNAKNDPFLTPECFPIKEAENNPHLFLEMPEEGGHCGFYEFNQEGIYWSEKRAVEFINKYI
jgi:predicted alpha/beta-fold hydrolase